LHQANAPAHTLSQAVAAITNAEFKLLHHWALYLQAMVPSILYMFPNLKEYLKELKIFVDKDVICTENSLPRQAGRITPVQWNPHFGEMLDQVHVSCR